MRRSKRLLRRCERFVRGVGKFMMMSCARMLAPLSTLRNVCRSQNIGGERRVWQEARISFECRRRRRTEVTYKSTKVRTSNGYQPFDVLRSAHVPRRRERQIGGAQ